MVLRLRDIRRSSGEAVTSSDNLSGGERGLDEPQPNRDLAQGLASVSAQPGERHDPIPQLDRATPPLAQPIPLLLGHLGRQPVTQPLEPCVIHPSTLYDPMALRKACEGEELRKEHGTIA